MECIFAAGLVTLHTRSVWRFGFLPGCLQADVTNLKMQWQNMLSTTEVKPYWIFLGAPRLGWLAPWWRHSRSEPREYREHTRHGPSPRCQSSWEHHPCLDTTHTGLWLPALETRTFCNTRGQRGQWQYRNKLKYNTVTLWAKSGHVSFIFTLVDSYCATLAVTVN